MAFPTFAVAIVAANHNARIQIMAAKIHASLFLVRIIQDAV